jgi:phospholipid/cholesterol/gamma-HCH transport system substrate-binding protein
MYEYTKKQYLSQLKVGILVSAGILVLALSLLFAGSLGDLFVKKLNIYALFDNIQGLRAGAPVRFSGLEIGSVKALDFAPGSRIRATIEIDAKALQFLKDDSRADILTLGLLGDKYVGISTGSPEGEPLKPGDTITGAVELAFQDVVQSSEQAIRRIDTLIREFQNIFRGLKIEKGSFVRLLSEPDFYDNLKIASRHFSVLFEKLNQGQGSLGRLLNDETLFHDLTASARDVQAFTSQLATSQGSLRKFIEDPGLYNHLSRASATLEDLLSRVEAGKGTLGHLVMSDTLYTRLEKAVQSLDNFLVGVESGGGIAGRMLYDEQFSVELVLTITELKKLLRDIRANPQQYFEFSIY